MSSSLTGYRGPSESTLRHPSESWDRAHRLPLRFRAGRVLVDPSFRWGDDGEGWEPWCMRARSVTVMGGYVYILASRKNGTLYIGVTADLATRVDQHRSKAIAGFTARYNVTRLVHAEWHDDIRDAIVREKAMKAWKRAWKVELIEEANPDWRDLFDDML